MGRAVKVGRGPEQDITDVIQDLRNGMGEKGFAQADFKVGKVMTFNFEGTLTTLEVTRIEDDKWYGCEIKLEDASTVASHYGHNVDTSPEVVAEHNAPYCQDCESPVSQEATKAGKQRAEERKENYLPDGTYIGDEPEEES